MSSPKNRLSLLFVVSLPLLGGCATKPLTPWQRGAFASYGMNPDRDPIAKGAQEHITTSREASSGGAGVGGSGCGCR